MIAEGPAWITEPMSCPYLWKLSLLKLSLETRNLDSGRVPPGWQLHADEVDTELCRMKGTLAVPEEGLLAQGEVHHTQACNAYTGVVSYL